MSTQRLRDQSDFVILSEPKILRLVSINMYIWHLGLSDKNRAKLERVQKSALKVILGKRYTTYSEALDKLKIESLEDRRKSLCLKFAKKCLQVEKLKKLFPRNVKNHKMLKEDQRY